MEQSELDSIIGESLSPIENTQNNTVEIQPDTSKPYTCDVCNKSFSTNLALIGHKRSHGIKEKSSLKNEVKATDVLPENIAFLKNVLKSFGAKGSQNILDGMADNPTDLTELRDLLASNENKSNVPYILKRYSNYIGMPIPEEKSSLQTQSGFGDMYGMAKQAMELKMMNNLFGDNNNNKPNTELEAIKLQMAQMAEANKRLEALLTQQKTDNEINLLKKELEDSKREYGGQLGSLSDSMKEVVTNIYHMQEKSSLENSSKFEKLLMEMRHEKETDILKKQIAEAQSSKPMAEKMLDVLDKKVDALGSGFGAALKETIKTEQADSIHKLIQSGIPPQQAMSIVGIPNRPNLPSAEQEYRNLERATQEIIKETPKPIEKPPEPQVETTPIDFSEHIKFNVGE